MIECSILKLLKRFYKQTKDVAETPIPFTLCNFIYPFGKKKWNLLSNRLR